jgi:hypothetical protein
MEQEPTRQESKGNLGVYVWLLSICVGLAVGAGLGAAMDSIGAGIGIGLAVGVAVGLFLCRRFGSESSGSEDPRGGSGSTEG